MLIASNFNYKEIDWEMEYAQHHDSHLQDFVETLQDFLYQHVTEPTRYLTYISIERMKKGQICWIWFYRQMRVLPIVPHWGKAIT